MIAAYIDESFDMGEKGIFAVGGVMARGVALFELERHWEKLCKRADIEIAYFKASECERGSGEFAKFVSKPRYPSPKEQAKLDSISHEFLALIPQCGFVIAFGIGVVQKDFYDVIRDPKARSVLGQTPYMLACHMAMSQCAWAMQELERAKTGKLQPWQKVQRDYVSFVFDETAQYSSRAHDAYREFKSANPQAAAYMATYSEADEKKNAVLQAADAAVFEIRRALNLELKQWEGALRKQFGIIADAKKMFLIEHTSKDQLLHIAATHEAGEAFKLDELMQRKFPESVALSIYRK